MSCPSASGQSACGAPREKEKVRENDTEQMIKHDQRSETERETARWMNDSAQFRTETITMRKSRAEQHGQDLVDQETQQQQRRRRQKAIKFASRVRNNQTSRAKPATATCCCRRSLVDELVLSLFVLARACPHGRRASTDDGPQVTIEHRRTRWCWAAQSIPSAMLASRGQVARSWRRVGEKRPQSGMSRVSSRADCTAAKSHSRGRLCARPS
jgi:hypothetical protein